MFRLGHGKPFRKTTQLSDGFSYYEYKYLVPHHLLSQVRGLLEEFRGSSDPFPSGVVDSIYYDTADEQLYAQCLNGDADKFKFRIRGYGDGSFRQMHLKIKALSSVSKLKCMIKAVHAPREAAPTWDDMVPTLFSPEYQEIQYQVRKLGPLFPSIRVRYFRYRYRAYDYRITLDTNIEVLSPINGLPRALSYATLPEHVLEIKTRDERPTLPFIGLIQLPQVSFSKFMLGLSLLNLELELDNET